MPLFGELFLSDILKKPVLDPKGEELGKVKDVAIVRGEPLPKIDSLIIESRKKAYRIPWPDLNIFSKRIIAATLQRENLREYDFGEEDLLASRDILDKQIVDANGAKVVRANDIKLEGFGSEAIVVAVDVGVRGILRRLGMERRGDSILGLFKVRMPYNLISWNYIQPLQPKLSNIALTVPGQMVQELHPADLADLISQVSPEEGASFIGNLDVETAAEAITELEPDAQTAMLTGMEPSRAAEIIEEMPPDSAADIISALPADRAKEILEQVQKEDAEDIQELMGHEHDTAGGLMTNEFIAYSRDMSVEEATAQFRRDALEIEGVYYIYVVDEDEKLLGVISLKELLLSDPGASLEEVMETNLKMIGPEEDEMKVAAAISKYNLVALPVVDNEGALMGIVTVDDVIDIILPPQAKRKRRKM
ncbi:MAG: CBS domain-containing protein [Nitrospirota bacterium]|jgi:CBS domain-containing protein